MIYFYEKNVPTLNSRHLSKSNERIQKYSIAHYRWLVERLLTRFLQQIGLNIACYRDSILN